VSPTNNQNGPSGKNIEEEDYEEDLDQLVEATANAGMATFGKKQA